MHYNFYIPCSWLGCRCRLVSCDINNMVPVHTMLAAEESLCPSLGWRQGGGHFRCSGSSWVQSTPGRRGGHTATASSGLACSIVGEEVDTASSTHHCGYTASILPCTTVRASSGYGLWMQPLETSVHMDTASRDIHML